MRPARVVVEPFSGGGKVIICGDDDLPAVMFTVSLESGGYVCLWADPDSRQGSVPPALSVCLVWNGSS
jgi:hypothetical protein